MDQLAKERLAKALREAMAGRNHSATKAAAEMGVSPPTVLNWSKGWFSNAPEFDHWRIIADYVGVPLYIVLEWVGLLNAEQVDLLATIPGTLQIAEQMALAWVGYHNLEDVPALADAV